MHDIEERARKALERQEKQYKRQNEYIKNNYYRVSATLPKEYKRILSDNEGSMNGYINRLVREDLVRRGLLPAANSQDATPASPEDEHGPEWLPFPTT